jgi:hypothetical protein
VVQKEQSAWDASDGAHPGVGEDEAHLLLERPEDAGAGKSVVRELDVRVRDARILERWPELSEPGRRDVAAVLCTPDAVQSAEQSYEARAWAAMRGAARLAETLEPPAQPTQRVQEPPGWAAELAERTVLAASPQDAEAEQRLQASEREVEVELAPMQAFPQLAPQDVRAAQVAQGLQREPAVQAEQPEQPISQRGAQRSASARLAAQQVLAEAQLPLPFSA